MVDKDKAYVALPTTVTLRANQIDEILMSRQVKPYFERFSKSIGMEMLKRWAIESCATEISKTSDTVDFIAKATIIFIASQFLFYKKANGEYKKALIYVFRENAIVKFLETGIIDNIEDMPEIDTIGDIEETSDDNNDNQFSKEDSNIHKLIDFYGYKQ